MTALITMSRQPKSEVESITREELGTLATPAPAVKTSFNDLDMLYAGRATFTLENPATGKRCTYRVDKVQNDVKSPAVYFVKFLIGQDNENDYQYLGMLSYDWNEFRLTGASKAGKDSDPVKGINWLLAKLKAGVTFATLPNGVRAVWAAECQRCGRTLTVVSSVDNRLGPICAKKMGRGE